MKPLLGQVILAMAQYRTTPERFFKVMRREIEDLLEDYEPSTGCIYLELNVRADLPPRQ